MGRVADVFVAFAAPSGRTRGRRRQWSPGRPTVVGRLVVSVASGGRVGLVVSGREIDVVVRVGRTGAVGSVVGKVVGSVLVARA